MIQLPQISSQDISMWVNRTDHDVRTWKLRAGAPKHMVDAFPEYIQAMLTPDSLPAETPKYDATMPKEVDMSNPSILMVRTWQLARDARRLFDEVLAIDLDNPLALRLEAHAQELELLHNQIHDALLTDEDRANGAINRPSAQD